MNQDAKPLSINWEDQPLGKMPDASLAKRIGCSLAAVHRARRHRGISAFQPQRFKRREESEPLDPAILGTDYDHVIAKRLGRTTYEIRQARKKHGIEIRRFQTEVLPGDSEEDRLRKRLAHWTVRDEKTGCLVWVGRLDKSGYGQLRLHNSQILPGKKQTKAHRLAWVLSGRAFDLEKPLICHRCDNRACVEVNHLFAGSKLDNARDMAEKDRGARSKTGLPRGVRPNDYEDGTRSFNATIRIGGKNISLGSFETVAEASSIYQQARAIRSNSGDDGLDGVIALREENRKHRIFRCCYYGEDGARCTSIASVWLTAKGKKHHSGPLCDKHVSAVELDLIIDTERQAIPQRREGQAE